MNLINKIKNELVSVATIKKFVIFMILLQIVRIGVLSLLHDPNYSFDESNTLRISAQSPADIVQILSLEQNFPFFYLFLHFLQSMNVSIHVIILGKLFLWIFSIYLFFFSVKKNTSNIAISYWMTLIYSLCSAIWIYAFYIRMYLLIVIFTELLILLLTDPNIRKNFKIISIYVLLATICLLHPAGFFMSALVGLFFYFSKSKKHSIGILISGLSILLISLSLKENFVLNFKKGTEYLQPFSFQNFSLAINGLFSIYSEGLNWIFILIFTYLSIRVFYPSISLKKNPLYRFFFFSVCLAMIIGLVSEFRLAIIPSRFFIILTVPLLMFMAAVISKNSKKIKLLISFFLFLVFFAQSQTWFRRMSLEEGINRKMCDNLQKLDSDFILTDFRTHNTLVYCIGELPNKEIWINSDGVKEISSLSADEILLLQAKQGGSITPGLRNSFKLFLLQNKPFAKKTVSDVQKALDMDDIVGLYVFLGMNEDNSLSAYELQMLSDYKIESYLEGGIYILKRLR